MSCSVGTSFCEDGSYFSRGGMDAFQCGGGLLFDVGGAAAKSRDFGAQGGDLGGVRSSTIRDAGLQDADALAERGLNLSVRAHGFLGGIDLRAFDGV
jgi:hypothetical protein